MSKEETVLRIKEAAQSIINNAESIVGDEKTRTNISITIDVNNVDQLPIINVTKELIPEGFLSRMK